MKAIKVTIQNGENFRLQNGSPTMHRVGKAKVLFLNDTATTEGVLDRLQHLAIIEEDSYDRAARLKAHKNNSTIEIRKPKEHKGKVSHAAKKKIKTMYGSKKKRS